MLTLSIMLPVRCSQFIAFHSIVQLDLYARAWYPNLLL